jgi:hypothetical protein
MKAKARSLVGLDVHARQKHAVVLDPGTGELGVSRLRMAPGQVVSFLDRLAPVLAVYEAGPTDAVGHSDRPRRSRGGFRLVASGATTHRLPLRDAAGLKEKFDLGAAA